ncbi:MAG: hypothetical protein WKF96_25275 [Solirubrobacteraceae bacterium]
MADPHLVEKYIRGQVLHRFMQRLREIEDEVRRHSRDLAQAHTDLADSWPGPGAFEERWLGTARAWRFDHVNDLIHSHNEYYPIERRPPINPRTGDYLTTSGRPWRREPAGPEWILERFPARRGRT